MSEGHGLPGPSRILMQRRFVVLLPLLGSLMLSPACGGEDVELAPKAEKLEQVAPKTQTAMAWTVQGTGSTVTFEMEAPFERQDGTVPATALSGSLHLDLGDLTKSTGLLTVDISALEIFMQKAEDEGQYGERDKSDLQNEHMRDWLEIGDDVPADILAKNRAVQFSLLEVTKASSADVTAMTGAERTVTLTVNGEMLLHQHKTPKTANLEATFTFDGDRATGLRVRTLSPFGVSLAEHDVRPRTGFGALAKKTLGAMSSKVGEQAAVSVSFSATPAPS